MRAERLGVEGGEGIEEEGAVQRSRPPFQKIQPTWASLHHVEIRLKISNTNICILEPCSSSTLGISHTIPPLSHRPHIKL